MSRSTYRSVLVAALLTAAGGAAATATPTPGSTPAATLLLPYFEVDTSDPGGVTTLFSVNNAGSEPVVAHVVVWTDWGIPTYSFDLALQRDDVQTVNLRDLFTSGSIPTTDGSGLSGCGDPVVAPSLDAAALAALRARHSGRSDPADGLCYGSEREDGRFVGYVTVDTARSCAGGAVYAPPDHGYFFSDFGGVPPDPFASDENVLWGDLFYVAGDDDSAQGVELVHVPYDPAAPAGETFYRAYVPEGQDNRAMLGSRYRGRYLDGGPFDGGTDLLVWLEANAVGEAMPCGAGGPQLHSCRMAWLDLADEDGNFSAGPDLFIQSLAFRLPLGGGGVSTPAPFGIFQLHYLELIGCEVLPIGSFPAQAWVTPVMKAQGRFSVGLPATRIPLPADD